jgi:hypothetical protein
MRKIAWIILCVVLCSGLVFSQSISVTNPTANKSWIKGRSYTIVWTKSGSMPNQVRIALVNEAANDIVHDIAIDTPNDGSYVWPIPMVAFPNGRYKIAVRAKGTNITGVSPAFNIRLKLGPVEAMPAPPKPRKEVVKIEPKVTITRPKSNSRWNFGESQDILIETNFDVYNFQMDLTSKGNVVYPIHSGPIDPYAKEGLTRKYRQRWHIGRHIDYGDGNYRVRVKARHKAEHAAVGTIGSRIYKSQVIFPLEFLINKNIIVLEATLLLYVSNHHKVMTGCMRSSARKLHVFTGPWTSSDPIPAYFYKNIPDVSRPTLDIRQQVVSWVSGQESNHGFLLTCLDDLSPCYSEYSPELRLKYREQK